MKLAAIAQAAVTAITAFGACSSGGYVTVTVDARPAVHDAKALAITLSNGGTTRTDTLALRDQPFPVTFSISSPGRTGDLGIAVDATDENGLVVGHGSAATKLAAPTASVELDSTDFVVNTDYAGDQFPSDDFEASGFQLAALPDGTWTAAFRDSCMAGSCNIFGRRFDRTGKPVQTALSASTNAFVLTTSPTTSASTPAIASGASTTIAVWDFFDPAGTAMGVACRALDTAGRASADQKPIANAEFADVVAVAALGNGNFVASWNTFVTATSTEVIHAAFIKPDCSALVPVQTVSTPTDNARRASVASSADQVLFAWSVDGNLHIRLASSAGMLTSTDTLLVKKTLTDEVAHARVAAAARGGFVIAARWTPLGLTGPGRIELLRVDTAGKLVGMPALITDKTALDGGANSGNDESFGMASRPDGTVLVAWHTCGEFADDNLCGVFGRIMSDTGDPVTDTFVIPTTTAGDQRLPSVVGLPDAFVATWSDASGKPPDIAGRGVRARIIYPP
jgi:hypothetical protein